MYRVHGLKKGAAVEPRTSAHTDAGPADADAPGLEARFPGKYLSVTSFKRDGSPVATPVWFVIENDRLLIHTDTDSFKAKRIGRNPSVTIAPCTATGRLLGDPAPATAELLPDGGTDRVMRLIRHKYRADRVLKLPFYNLVQRLRGVRTRGRPVTTIAITPASAGSGPMRSDAG
jgi:PPOX class probable F420-dependent enzyme